MSQGPISPNSTSNTPPDTNQLPTSGTLGSHSVETATSLPQKTTHSSKWSSLVCWVKNLFHRLFSVFSKSKTTPSEATTATAQKTETPEAQCLMILEQLEGIREAISPFPNFTKFDLHYQLLLRSFEGLKENNNKQKRPDKAENFSVFIDQSFRKIFFQQKRNSTNQYELEDTLNNLYDLKTSFANYSPQIEAHFHNTTSGKELKSFIQKLHDLANEVFYKTTT